MYHNVLPRAVPSLSKHLYVTRAAFEWQMRSLRRGGYTAISFSQLYAALHDGEELPKKPVLITFDDGYKGLVENARPVLNELAVPYTVFLVSSLVGRSNEWDRDLGYPELALMDWDEIQTLEADGLAKFEAHTVTHAHLDQLNPRDCVDEIAGSRDAIEAKLGRKLDVFCYPYGHYNDAVRDVVRESGFRMAVTTTMGRVRENDGLLDLPRISIYHVPAVSLTYGLGGPNFWWRVVSNKDKRPVIA
ncbi:MAG: polysaccharide deacetylase family protein [Capsulimonadaceae bacterium]|nr:polysaccharide deacetylase family protein [Capsulimonadaceae bacterium]